MQQKLELGITPGQIEEIFASGVQRTVSANDLQWVEKEQDLHSKNKRAQWWRRLFRSTKVERVKGVYEKKWTPEAALSRFTHREENCDPVIWGDRRYFAYGIWIKRVHLLFLMRVIETLKPKRVLEVGSGMGLNLLLLAARFPEIQFSGIELTASGHEVAQALRASPKLPDELKSFSPLPIMDDQAHHKVELFQASAAQLPFEKNTFDLVYSIQALEQMEGIRDEVFAELARVCSGHIAMFEPFSDWNKTVMRQQLITSRKFFSAGIDDLRRYGFEPVFASDDMPTKLTYGVGLVVARRVQER